jgi:hypothetical protein
LTVKLDKTLYDSVTQFCTEHDLNISQTVRRALRDYITVLPSNTTPNNVLPSKIKKENSAPALDTEAEFDPDWADKL